MRLKLKKTGEIFDEKRHLAVALIEAGVCEEVLPTPPPPAPTGPVTWNIVRLSVSGAPELRAWCPTCQRMNGCVSIGRYIGYKQVCGFGEAAAWRDGKPGKFFGAGFTYDAFIPPQKNARHVAENFKFWHCGRADAAPPEIVQQFVNAWDEHAHKLESPESGPKVRIERPPFSAIAEPNYDVTYKQSDGFGHSG